MAGRGRGTSGTLTHSQLQSLGCIGKEMPQVPAAPPPTFPPLFTKPIKFESTPTLEYKLMWKSWFFEDFTFDNKVQAALKKSKPEETPFNWNRMPVELKTKHLKRRGKANNEEVVPPKVGNLEEHFKVLEESEKQANDDDEAPEKPVSDSEIEEEGELVDEELDEDNDYGHNYFDNGEAYNEEDDNLDDGPIY